jgi:hypothetical protein
MCAACGVLGGGADWLDQHGDRARKDGLTTAAERQQRIALVNLLLEGPGLRLRKFGPSMVIAAATGRAEIIDDLRHVWMQADQLSKQQVDLLDPAFLDRLSERFLD